MIATDNELSDIGELTIPAKIPARRKLLIALYAITVTQLIVICFFIGVRHWMIDQQDRITGDDVDTRHSIWSQNYGRTLRDFTIYDGSGRRFTNQDLHGHWTLLLLADPACDACSIQLGNLGSAYKGLRDYVTVMPVIRGYSVFRSPVQVAHDFQTFNRFPFSVYADPDQQISLQCDARKQDFPHSLLIDPSGIVRLDYTGVGGLPNNSTQLTECIKAFFTGSYCREIPMTSWHEYNRIDENRVVRINGTTTTLGKLSSSDLLIATFLTGSNIAREWRKLETLKPYSKAPNVKLLFICRSLDDIPPALKQLGSNVLISYENTGPLFEAFDVHKGPVSALIFRGRRLVFEADTTGSNEPFERAAACSVLLNQSPKLQH